MPNGGRESLHLQLISEEQQQPLITASRRRKCLQPHAHTDALTANGDVLYGQAVCAEMNSKGAPVVKTVEKWI